MLEPWITDTGPDLQKLVEHFGGYNRITPEAWAAYHAEMEYFKAAIRSGQTYAPLHR